MTVYHSNDTRSTVTRWSFDNDQRHVTAFRPISEVAHSWLYDNQIWRPSVKKVALGLRPRATFSTSGSSYLVVVWPTMSCFADWSKCCYVTLSLIICSPLYGHPGWHTMSPGWHYNVTAGDREAVTWRSENANVRCILRCFCLRFVCFCLFFWRYRKYFY